MSDDNFVSSDILDTYYAKSRFPSDEELQTLGIDPTEDAHLIHNSPETPLPSFLAQVEGALRPFLTREPH